MLTLRPAAERGRTLLDWLDSRHSFSFGAYHDPRHRGFRSLRVINDDIVAPGAGFGTHPHADMEIVTYVLAGRLRHRDSTGAGGVLEHGDVQAMSAGAGIEHSEVNDSADEPVRFLQIWLRPARAGLAPAYGQRRFPIVERAGSLVPIVAPHGAEGDALPIHQDARIYAARLRPGDAVRHDLAPGRHAWIQVARGALAANGHELREGDGAAVSDEPALELRTDREAEVLVFDLS